MANPGIRYGIRFTSTSYVLRVTRAGAENLTFPATGSLDTTHDYYMTGDGGAYDLLALLELCIESHTEVSNVTLALDSDDKVTVSSAESITINWSHGSTTLDATVFGWLNTVDSSTGTSFTSTNTVQGVWNPGRMPAIESRDSRVTVGGIGRTLSGKARASSFLGADSLKKERDFRFRNLLQTTVLQEYQAADHQYNTLEYAWHYSMALGYKWRYYADETQHATMVYNVYQVRSLEDPYRRAENYRIHWDADILAVLDEVVT